MHAEANHAQPTSLVWKMHMLLYALQPVLFRQKHLSGPAQPSTPTYNSRLSECPVSVVSV